MINPSLFASSITFAFSFPHACFSFILYLRNNFSGIVLDTSESNDKGSISPYPCFHSNSNSSSCISGNRLFLPQNVVTNPSVCAIRIVSSSNFLIAGNPLNILSCISCAFCLVTPNCSATEFNPRPYSIPKSIDFALSLRSLPSLFTLSVFLPFSSR